MRSSSAPARRCSAADKGFCPAEAKFKELAEQVDTLAIPRRMQTSFHKVLAHWQAFRAGIEGLFPV